MLTKQDHVFRKPSPWLSKGSPFVYCQHCSNKNSIYSCCFHLFMYWLSCKIHGSIQAACPIKSTFSPPPTLDLSKGYPEGEVLSYFTGVNFVVENSLGVFLYYLAPILQSSFIFIISMLIFRSLNQYLQLILVVPPYGIFHFGSFRITLSYFFQDPGTRDHDLIRLIVTRSEIDLASICEAYLVNFKKTLAEEVTDECRGPLRDYLVAIIRGNSI